ncbi:MAG: dihydrolipoamide acetyltransferase family protein [Anaerolineae bacterium]
MATIVPLPKLGNTVESVIVLHWRKAIGEPVAVGDVLLEVETDKASMDVESQSAGVVLAHLVKEGDEVPVLAPMVVIGEAGEQWTGDSIAPASASPTLPPTAPSANADLSPVPLPKPAILEIHVNGDAERLKISPRARHLAERKAVTVDDLQGSGPEGRIIERDIEAAISNKVRPTPVARSMMEKGGFGLPEGAAGRIGARDLTPPSPGSVSASSADDVTVIPLKGARKVIAQRMLESIQTTAQLTMHRSADARALKRLRERLKNSSAGLGLQAVTINDLVLFAVARTLTQHLNLNSLLVDNAIHQYQRVHLGVAVDTPRGLLVPVIRDAHQLTLKQLSGEAKRLILACTDGKVTPDELNGGTFTVTNLGGLGIEQFTPILNLPQSAILGVGNIQLKAVEGANGVEFLPHISLSLTINHQIIDGAPAARFLETLAGYLKEIDILLAV